MWFVMMLWKRMLLMLPAIIWVALIFHLSSQPYREQTIVPLLSERISKDALSDKLPDLTLNYGRVKMEAKRQPFHFVEFLFRKACHMFLYATWALLIMLALRPYDWKARRKWVCVLLLVLGVAALDEWNQAREEQRTGMVQDVGIDMLGGMMAMTVRSLPALWRSCRP